MVLLLHYIVAGFNTSFTWGVIGYKLEISTLLLWMFMFILCNQFELQWKIPGAETIIEFTVLEIILLRPGSI